jgi:acyl CoA:acetate/3-ketoacid CoA transferase alpha subunit
MGKYQEDAKLLLEYVGGKENIAAVSHCVSRMRFVLNDPAKADVAKIEALKSAKIGNLAYSSKVPVLRLRILFMALSALLTCSLQASS